MRIGILTGEYPPMEGGVGDYTRELSKALVASGHHIDVLTSHLQNPDIQTDRFPIQRTIRHWSAISAFPTIRKWLTSTNPDIVNIQYQAAAYQMKGGINLLPTWLSNIQHRPVTVTFHDLLPPYLFPKAGSLRKRAVYYLAKSADGVIVTNEEDEQELLQNLGNACPPLQIIPIGSNISNQPPSTFTVDQWRDSHGLTPQDILIGFFGFMNRSKGVDILIDAVADLRYQGYPVKLLFIGGRT
ncbi:MAG: glycosyltransferase family 4 protein, partial [Anaerolineae bacterium]|nr:glycosyltransferase family 4 protein [Anaerolineae bacterium]